MKRVFAKKLKILEDPMKKGLLVFCIGMLVLLFVGCSSKTALSDEEFCTKLEDQGFEMYDATEQFEGEAESVTVAMNSDYQVEFYVMPSVEDAAYLYNLNKEKFAEAEGGSSINTSVSVANYSTYTLSTPEGYVVVSRVDNTFLYCNVDASHKADIEQIVKDLGY